MQEVLICEQCANHQENKCICGCELNDDKCKQQFCDIDCLMEDLDCDEFEPAYEEQRKRYLPIRWLINLLLKYLNEDSWTMFNGISFKPRGQKRECEEFPLWLSFYFRSIWVDQYRNGGYTGDDFAGNLYLRLFPFVYLVFNYEC